GAVGAGAATEAGVASANAASGAPHIRLSAGYDFVPTRGVPSVPEDLTLRLGAEPDPSALQTYLVQFASMPNAKDLARLAAAGAAVSSYLPDQAYVVRMTSEARAR